ncbi:SPOR domain-containing protein [Paracoccus sp. (in: a-proteobacteria)]|uniref:SPOR domain-containing protein n=1 Tax=Paracoccus sp. TaxID=267 RepID=UPI0026E028FE|nr:SPOR domain-containing protein [Paracoccus sp. (in: a-proteobacteria)]MDO5648059.1 SPOR domain-containing protein [Paracoccus sp. (in: a-proteobacteria)]
MRFFGILAGLWAMMAAVWAAPPDDFAGAQYIDAAGCVMLRDGDGWTARRDRSGAPVCGFPPSFVDAPVATMSPQDAVMEQLSAGLRQGEWQADPRAPAEIADGPRPDGTLNAQQQLAQMAVAQRAVEQALSAPVPGSDVCARLGYRVEPGAQPLLTGDVTQGLCPGMRAPLPQPRTVAGQGAETPKPAPVVAAKPAPPRAKPAAQPPRPVRVAAAPTAQPGPEMIPASARYVQVGVYQDAGNAQVVIRSLSSLGYPVAQGRTPGGDAPARVVMAGPFADRQALIAALNRLRGNGWPNAVAR